MFLWQANGKMLPALQFNQMETGGCGRQWVHKLLNLFGVSAWDTSFPGTMIMTHTACRENVQRGNHNQNHGIFALFGLCLEFESTT